MKIPTKSTTGAGTIADADGENTRAAPPVPTRPAGRDGADSSHDRIRAPTAAGGGVAVVADGRGGNDDTRAVDDRPVPGARAGTAWSPSAAAGRGEPRDADRPGRADSACPTLCEDCDDDAAEPEDPRDPLVSAAAAGIAHAATPMPSASASAPTRPTLKGGPGRTPGTGAAAGADPETLKPT